MHRALNYCCRNEGHPVGKCQGWGLTLGSLTLSLGSQLRLYRQLPISRELSPIGGEGNGTPLQYSFLENPMDGGAW